ncbi:MAG TPA: DUF302 domain-containing protein [Chloroflexota bacterium]|jgi:uncharacterized protein (DUF302 family)|nr:DUF302 domain-containing protein [Chloroflexota bacterium]
MDDGLVTVPSSHTVAATVDRLEAAIIGKGMTVFARIDHAKAAAEAGLTLRPTELLVFGSPVAGTPLMQQRQMVGIDLPLKALAWEDRDGRVWLTYNDVAWIARRHGIEPAGHPELARMAAVVADVTSQAVAGNPTASC